MSNRYVWERFNLGELQTNIVGDYDGPNPSFPLNEEADLASEGSLLITYGTSYSRDGAAFRVSPKTDVTVNNHDNDWSFYSETSYDVEQIPFDVYFYVNNRNNRVYHFAGVVTTNSAAYVDVELEVRPLKKKYNTIVFSNSGANSQSVVSAHEMRRIVKNNRNGTVSNSASSTYPPRDYPSKSARIWPYSAPGT